MNSSQPAQLVPDAGFFAYLGIATLNGGLFNQAIDIFHVPTGASFGKLDGLWVTSRFYAGPPRTFGNGNDWRDAFTWISDDLIQPKESSCWQWNADLGDWVVMWSVFFGVTRDWLGLEEFCGRS
jgi:hypothetical protein